MLLDQPGNGAGQHYHTHIPLSSANAPYLPHPWGDLDPWLNLHIHRQALHQQ